MAKPKQRHTHAAVDVETGLTAQTPPGTGDTVAAPKCGRMLWGGGLVVLLVAVCALLFGLLYLLAVIWLDEFTGIGFRLNR